MLKEHFIKFHLELNKVDKTVSIVEGIKKKNKPVESCLGIRFAFLLNFFQAVQYKRIDRGSRKG